MESKTRWSASKPMADCDFAQAPAPRKWWGWGDPDKRATLSEGALAMLCSQLGQPQPGHRVSIEEVAIPAPRELPASVLEAVNAASVLTSHEHRVRRAAGSSYPDLVRL